MKYTCKDFQVNPCICMYIPSKQRQYGKLVELSRNYYDLESNGTMFPTQCKAINYSIKLYSH